MKNYTVSQLAKLSGVTVRSLHFYDELGLLKPAFTAENGYRYYQEKQLLVLQQILFFRELGFELKQIQEIINKSDFDQRASLQSHKKVLQEKIEHMKTLMTTIDKTINHLQGTQTMSEKELFFGLQNYSPELQERIRSMMQNNAIFKKTIDQIYEAQKGLTAQEKEKMQQETTAFWKGLASVFNKKLKIDDVKVQELIHAYDLLLKRGGSTHDKKQFINMAEYMPKQSEYHKKALTQYPELKEQYAKYQIKVLDENPGLAEFMAEAMKFYAEHNLVENKESIYQTYQATEEQKKQQEETTKLWCELAHLFNKGHKTDSSKVQFIMEQYRQLTKTQYGFNYTPEMFMQMAEYTPTMLEHHKKLATDFPQLAKELQKADKVFYDNPGLLEF